MECSRENVILLRWSWWHSWPRSCCILATIRPRRTGPSFVPHLKQSSLAPDFSLQSLDGKTLRLSDFRGKAVLLNFWATWCGPCKIEMPWFVELQNQLRDAGIPDCRRRDG